MTNSIRGTWRRRLRNGEVLPKKQRTSVKWCKVPGCGRKRRGKNHDKVLHGG